MTIIQQYFPFAIAGLAAFSILFAGLGIREQVRNMRARYARDANAF